MAKKRIIATGEIVEMKKGEVLKKGEESVMSDATADAYRNPMRAWMDYRLEHGKCVGDSTKVELKKYGKAFPWILALSAKLKRDDDTPRGRRRK